MLSERTIYEMIPQDMREDYDINKEYLKRVTMSDISNISQALMEQARKGPAPTATGGGCQMCCCAMCCCAMCCCAAAVRVQGS